MQWAERVYRFHERYIRDPVQHSCAVGFALLQVFDAVIIVASFVVDLVFLNGLQAFPLDDSIFILAFLLPWRVIRVVNSECTVLSFSPLPRWELLVNSECTVLSLSSLPP